MLIILMGPQGCGKGTQARMLSEKLGVPHVGMGDLLRAMKNARVQAPLLKGVLVPDEFVLDALLECISQPDCGKGFVLDGYPRTLKQAKALDELLMERDESLDAVVYLSLSKEECVKRLSGRRTCWDCGKVYGVSLTPDITRCECGGELFQRKDDQPQAIEARFKEYEEKTKPLTAYYAEKGLLKEVDGSGAPQETFEKILSVLKQK